MGLGILASRVLGSELLVCASSGCPSLTSPAYLGRCLDSGGKRRHDLKSLQTVRSAADKPPVLNSRFLRRVTTLSVASSHHSCTLSRASSSDARGTIVFLGARPRILVQFSVLRLLSIIVVRLSVAPEDFDARCGFTQSLSVCKVRTVT